MWKGAFFVHFLPAINSILLPNSNRMLHFPFSFSFSSFSSFSTFSLLSLALSDSICSRSNLVFSDWQHDTYTVGGPTYNGWQIFPFFAQNPSEKTEKMPLFRKEYIYDTIQSQWIDISCFDLACIAFQWVVNYIDIKKKHFIWAECK